MVSAAVRVAAKDGKLAEAVIAAGCVAPRTVRLQAVEEGLVSGTLNLEGESLEVAVAGALHPVADILGSRGFKTYLNSVLIADLIRQCAREVLK